MFHVKTQYKVCVDREITGIYIQIIAGVIKEGVNDHKYFIVKKVKRNLMKYYQSVWELYYCIVKI